MATIFSLQGRGLSLNTREDVEPLLANADPALVEEVHFGGNTIGIEAAEAIADFLRKTQVLKVRFYQKMPRICFDTSVICVFR